MNEHTTTSENPARSMVSRAHEHLQRHEVKRLREVLAGVPGLVEDLLNVECRTARLSKPGMSKGRRPKQLGSSVPFHIGAAEAADLLHATLVGWVRVMLDQGRGRGHPADATLSIAAWLHRNAEALALCEGSAEALDEIERAVGECRRMVDIPPDDEVVIDPRRLEAANKSLVTLSTIETIARKIGEPGRGLNRERLRLLAKHRDVKPASEDGQSGTKFYRLGDVIDAHLRRKARISEKLL